MVAYSGLWVMDNRKIFESKPKMVVRFLKEIQ